MKKKRRKRYEKINLYFVIGVFIACSGEETLTPMEVKNWYVITPTENMDEVDDMIYRLYEKYDLAIFYQGYDRDGGSGMER